MFVALKRLLYCGVKIVPQYGGLLSKVYLQSMHTTSAKLPAPFITIVKRESDHQTKYKWGAFLTRSSSGNCIILDWLCFLWNKIRGSIEERGPSINSVKRWNGMKQGWTKLITWWAITTTGDRCLSSSMITGSNLKQMYSMFIYCKYRHKPPPRT